MVSYSTWEPILQALPCGNFLLSGQSRDSTTKVILIKYSPTGDTLFSRRYENFGQDGLFIKLKAKAVNEANDQYLLVSEEVETASLNDADIVVTKVDENGDIIWRKRLASNNINEIPHSAIPWDNGGFIIGAQFNNTIIVDQNYIGRPAPAAFPQPGGGVPQRFSQRPGPATMLRRGLPHPGCAGAAAGGVSGGPVGGCDIRIAGAGPARRALCAAVCGCARGAVEWAVCENVAFLCC